MTSYNEIFQLALTKIQDTSLAQWPEEDLTNELYVWLMAAIAGLPQINNELANRDIFDVGDTETKGFIADLSNVTKEVLALAMARQWLRPQINSTSITLQRYSKKEGYSQKEHLNGLMALDKSMDIEIKKLLRDNTYTGDNGYFD